MAVHDRWARITPYELAFPRLDEARRSFEEIRGAGAPGALDDPGRFLVSEPVVALLTKLHGDADPERLREHGILLFHAYHFWSEGERLLLAETRLVRRLVEDGVRPTWTGALATRAGYLQLPWHLVWTDPGEGERPESVDGLFWTAPEGTGQLSLLLVAGVRPDRPGFSVVPVLPVPLVDAPAWTELVGREEGGDFESTLPGAELERLLQVRTAGEVLKLAARALGWLEAHPPVPAPAHEGGGPPEPTRLPHRRMEID